MLLDQNKQFFWKHENLYCENRQPYWTDPFELCVCVCASSNVDGVLSEVHWVQGGGQGCVQMRASEPQTVHRAAHWVRAQLEELHNKQKMKLHYNSIICKLVFKACEVPYLMHTVYTTVMYFRLYYTHLQAFPLPFVPESYNTVVRWAACYHVISVCLDAVQSAVMRLLPLHYTLPVGKDGKEFTHIFLCRCSSTTYCLVLECWTWKCTEEIRWRRFFLTPCPNSKWVSDCCVALHNIGRTLSTLNQLCTQDQTGDVMTRVKDGWVLGVFLCLYLLNRKHLYCDIYWKRHNSQWLPPSGDPGCSAFNTSDRNKYKQGVGQKLKMCRSWPVRTFQ